MSDQKMKLYAGGTLSPREHYYVERSEDKLLYKLCKEGEYCYILAARQLGKSSLAANAILNLEKENIRTIYVDLQGIGKQPNERDIDFGQDLNNSRQRLNLVMDIDASDVIARKSQNISSYQDKWYLSLLHAVLSECREIRDDVNLEDWWTSKPGLDNIQKMTAFFSEILLARINRQIVVFIDEIDRFPEKILSDDFFMALRKMHNDRFNNVEFKRLSFVIIGHRLPRSLIQDKSISPFNIGTRLDLEDFQVDKASILTNNIKLGSEISPLQVIETVFSFTGGHPYMTHEACKYLSDITNDDDEEDRYYLNTEEQVAQVMDYLVKKTFAEKHLNKIQDWLNARPNQIEVLRLYGYILEGSKVLFDETIQPLDDLRYSGLIKIEKSGEVFVRNQIYATVFNREWVFHELRDKHSAISPADFSFGLERLGLRTYGEVVEAWPDYSQIPIKKEDESKNNLPTNKLNRTENLIKQSRKPNQDNLPPITKEATGNNNPRIHGVKPNQSSSLPIVGKEPVNKPKKSSSNEPEKINLLPAIWRHKNFLLTLIGVIIGFVILIWSVSAHSVYLVALSSLLLFIFLLTVAIRYSTRGDSALAQRLDQYLEDAKPDLEAQRYVLTNWVVSRRGERDSFLDHVTQNLAQADLKLRASEYLAVLIVATVSMSIIFGLVGNWHVIWVSLGAVIGFLIPNLYVKRRQDNRLRHFENQLLEALDLMVNGLRAGTSTIQALESVIREFSSPISDEFRRAVQEMQIGISMEIALEHLVRRVPSSNLDFIVGAINVQREAGGNLAEILDSISYRLTTQKLDTIWVKGLNYPSFAFFYVCSSIFLILHTILFSSSPGLFSLENELMGVLGVLFFMWSLIFIVIGFVRIKKAELVLEITGKIQKDYIVVWASLSLTIAYIFGVPDYLLLGLVVLLFSYNKFGVVLLSSVWMILFFNFVINNFPVALVVSERFQKIKGFPENVLMDGQVLGITPLGHFFTPSDWLFWIIFSVCAVAFLVIIVIVSVRTTKSNDDYADPVLRRLSDATQHGEDVSLEEVELSQSFWHRLIIPLLDHLGKFFFSFTPMKTLVDTTRNLEWAGNPGRIGVAIFLMTKFLCAFVFGGFLILISILSPNKWTVESIVLVVTLFSALGFFFPNIWLQNRINKRRTEVRRTMPYALDLLRICVEAGLGFEAAMSKVAEKWENELSILFGRCIREIQLGKTQREALRDMADRVGLPELTSFVAAVIQSQALGVSFAKVLRTQSDSIYTTRREHNLSSLKRLDVICKILLVVLFGPILMFWLAWPILGQLL